MVPRQPKSCRVTKTIFLKGGTTRRALPPQWQDYGRSVCNIHGFAEHDTVAVMPSEFVFSCVIAPLCQCKGQWPMVAVAVRHDCEFGLPLRVSPLALSMCYERYFSTRPSLTASSAGSLPYLRIDELLFLSCVPLTDRLHVRGERHSFNYFQTVLESALVTTDILGMRPIFRHLKTSLLDGSRPSG
mmetsp:Transcript_18850/g.50557  ORF Transcript_18850/g.50557 Transcript_18850/m.50557 type:complete len:186 (-) Transcript_18850:8-565(-)